MSTCCSGGSAPGEQLTSDDRSAVAPHRGSLLPALRPDCATCDGTRLVLFHRCEPCRFSLAMGGPELKGCPLCVEVDCPACRPVAVGLRSE